MIAGGALRKALEEAYKVFASYPQPDRLGASPLRDPATILRRLTRAPLREAAGEDVGPYAGWALTTVGNADDYRLFLPRILEITVGDGSWMGTLPEVIALRLDYAGWRDWPRAEQAAVTDVFTAAFEQSSLTHPDIADASSWLCGLALMTEAIEPLLRTWATRRTTETILHLASFVRAVPDLTKPPSEEDAFWKDVDPDTRHVIAAWIGGGDVAIALDWLEDQVNPDDAYLLEQARELLAQRRLH